MTIRIKSSCTQMIFAISNKLQLGLKKNNYIPKNDGFFGCRLSVIAA